MRKLGVVTAAAAVALVLGVVPASAVVIKTNWVEKTPVSEGGTYTMYVRQISITKTTWRARVGLANRTGQTMKIQYGLVKEGARTILRHGPGIWFKGPAPGSTYTVARHVDATTVRPPLPHTLREREELVRDDRGADRKAAEGPPAPDRLRLDRARADLPDGDLHHPPVPPA